MRVEGKLVKILTQETGVSKTNKEWKKQSIVIEQEKDYNKEVVVTFFGDNISNLQSKKIGDRISCDINLSSREYNGKYYHNIDGWKCSLYSSSDDYITAVEEGKDHKGSDDLPF